MAALRCDRDRDAVLHLSLFRAAMLGAVCLKPRSCDLWSRLVWNCARGISDGARRHDVCPLCCSIHYTISFRDGDAVLRLSVYRVAPFGAVLLISDGARGMMCARSTAMSIILPPSAGDTRRHVCRVSAAVSILPPSAGGRSLSA